MMAFQTLLTHQELTLSEEWRGGGIRGDGGVGKGEGGELGIGM